MLPPHLPQNARARPLSDGAKRSLAPGLKAASLARPAAGNSRRSMKAAPAPLKPPLRVIGEPRG